MERKLDLSEIFVASWKTLKSEFWLLVGLLIGYVLISLSLFVCIPDNEGLSITAIAILLISLVFSVIFTLGYTKNLFQALDKEEPQFSAYGKQSMKFFTFLFANLLYTIIVSIGLLLLIVPGVYLAIRLQFFAALIVDERAGIISSLKRSWEITKGHTFNLFLLFLVMTCLYMAGFVFFIVGSFVVIPFISLMYCFIFRKLTFPTL